MNADGAGCSLQAARQAAACSTERPPRTALTLSIPAYFRPGQEWERLARAAPPVAMAIVNPNSGPGDACDPAYAATVAASRAAGISVLGYVDTARTARDPDTVDRDIARYYAWYPVAGIFLDQASTNPDALSYYAAVRRSILSRDAAARVVLNPGTATDERYMAVADIIVTFEDTYRAYMHDDQRRPWERRYPPERFWHLVHTTRTARQMRRAVALAKARGVGHLYVTSAAMPNPWDRLPGPAYWDKEQAAAAASLLAGR